MLMNFDTFGVPNAMRHAAKEKSDELTVLSQELDSKLLELKNF